MSETIDICTHCTGNNFIDEKPQPRGSTCDLCGSVYQGGAGSVWRIPIKSLFPLQDLDDDVVAKLLAIISNREVAK